MYPKSINATAAQHFGYAISFLGTESDVVDTFARQFSWFSLRFQRIPAVLERWLLTRMLKSIGYHWCFSEFLSMTIANSISRIANVLVFIAVSLVISQLGIMSADPDFEINWLSLCFQWFPVRSASVFHPAIHRSVGYHCEINGFQLAQCRWRAACSGQ